ncbi:uncharacterized protein isoform X1 [Leptinotarsa decemlineata]|uniref:uncharacterized protein isoform X1 n=1 Tax=Leptinotarsa decemlineata TaxID=7539 RepID=UPI003D30A055
MSLLRKSCLSVQLSCHSLRTYHQVQAWLGITLNPFFCGWISTPQALNPKMMTRDAAPQHLLQMISCGCSKGLKCSSVCRHCIGASCDNIPDVAVVDIPEGDDLSDVEMGDDL